MLLKSLVIVLLLLALQVQPASAVNVTCGQCPKAFGHYSKVNSQVSWIAVYNVASITDQGTGTVEVKFQTPMATDKYVVVVSAENTSVAWAWNRQPTGFWISTGMDRKADFVVYGIQ